MTKHIGGPFFEDFSVGQLFDSAPGVTLDWGHAAIHQALFGDRLRLPLDHTLSRDITGKETALANPSLVCNIAIGQTTEPSQRVKGNLFYRGLIFRQPVFIGDTLRTTTKVVALKQNRIKPGRAATGMVVLEMHVENQHGDTVLHFWRCPMIPCRDPDAATGHQDSFDAIPAEIDLTDVVAVVPKWNLAKLRAQVGGEHFTQLSTGTSYQIESRDTVTCAPELVRMTLNLAMTHTDAGTSAYNRRLVYGGHTISMAAAQLCRALPNLVTVLAWRSCDHTGPVFEGDILASNVTIDALHPLKGSQSGLVDLHVIVKAERGDQAPEPGSEANVLDWRLIGLMA